MMEINMLLAYGMVGQDSWFIYFIQSNVTLICKNE